MSLLLRRSRPVPADPTLPPALPTWGYADHATTAWLSAQVAACEIDDLLGELAALRARLANGRAWFARHDAGHADYQLALATRNALELAQTRARTALDLRRLKCWAACRDTYVCCSYLPRAQWPDGLDAADSPQAIWRQLRGGEPAPGRWPVTTAEAERELWVEPRGRRRAAQVEPWNQTDLEALLHERGIR